MDYYCKLINNMQLFIDGFCNYFVISLLNLFLVLDTLLYFDDCFWKCNFIPMIKFLIMINDTIIYYQIWTIYVKIK